MDENLLKFIAAELFCLLVQNTAKDKFPGKFTDLSLRDLQSVKREVLESVSAVASNLSQTNIQTWCNRSMKPQE